MTEDWRQGWDLRLGKVEQRDVFFFPGYDVAGIKRYHRYLRRQCSWYQRRFDVEFHVGDLAPTDLEGWSAAKVSAQWPDGRVQTNFHFCNWRDDVAKDYAPAAPIRIWRMLKGVAHLAVRGHIIRTARKAPKFVAALGLPVYLSILRAFCLVAAVWLAAQGGLLLIAGAAFGLGSLYGLKRLGDGLFESFFNNYLAYLERVLYEPGHGIGQQLDSAIASLADHARSARPGQDELLIVGHSYGSVPAVTAADIITRKDIDVSLLTVGSIAACVALSPEDKVFRPPAEALHRSDRICWREYFAPQDSLCFSRLAMVRDFDLDVSGAGKANIKMLSARFGETMAPSKMHKFRYNLLRLHFHFLMAVDHQGRYDFHRFALGPDSLGKASP